MERVEGNGVTRTTLYPVNVGRRGFYPLLTAYDWL